MISNSTVKNKHWCVALLVTLTACIHFGCGVVYSYKHSEDRLTLPLSMMMTKSDIDQVLGEPGKVVKDSGRVQVLEYRLYPRYHWLKELAVCPFTAWLGGCLFYPSIGVRDPNFPKPFYVVFYEDQLCLWGTLDMISESTACYGSHTASPNYTSDRT